MAHLAAGCGFGLQLGAALPRGGSVMERVLLALLHPAGHQVPLWAPWMCRLMAGEVRDGSSLQLLFQGEGEVGAPSGLVFVPRALWLHQGGTDQYLSPPWLWGGCCSRCLVALCSCALLSLGACSPLPSPQPPEDDEDV